MEFSLIINIFKSLPLLLGVEEIMLNLSLKYFRCWSTVLILTMLCTGRYCTRGRPRRAGPGHERTRRIRRDAGGKGGDNGSEREYTAILPQADDVHRGTPRSLPHVGSASGMHGNFYVFTLSLLPDHYISKQCLL